MIGIISVTGKGNGLAEKLAKSLDGTLYLKTEIEDFKLSKVTEEAMLKHKGIIFISSTGIAVRAIAEFLKGKDKDPAIVVVDLSNKYTISLISGHIGGANDLAIQVSKILNNIPIITTATDNLGVVAPDVIAVKNSLVIESLKKAKTIATLLVNGEIIGFKDDRNLIDIPSGYKRIENLEGNCVWITNKMFFYTKLDEIKLENNILDRSKANIDYIKVENRRKDVNKLRNVSLDNEKILRLIRKDIVLGIGCRRGIESSELEEFIIKTLKDNNIDYRSVIKIGSIDIKKNEKAINDLSEKLGCEFKTFLKEEIEQIHNKFEGSDFVEKTLGVRSVSEPVVELMGGTIIIPKIKFNGMTLTIGQI